MFFLFFLLCVSHIFPKNGRRFLVSFSSLLTVADILFLSLLLRKISNRKDILFFLEYSEKQNAPLLKHFAKKKEKNVRYKSKKQKETLKRWCYRDFQTSLCFACLLVLFHFLPSFSTYCFCKSYFSVDVCSFSLIIIAVNTSLFPLLLKRDLDLSREKSIAYEPVTQIVGG